MKKKFVYEAVYKIGENELIIFSGATNTPAVEIIKAHTNYLERLFTGTTAKFELSHFSYQLNKTDENGTQKKS